MDIGTVIAAIGAAALTGFFGWVTQKAAAKAAVRNAELSSRTDIEREAFERAKGFYTDVIDRQAAEQLEADREIAGLRLTVGQHTTDLATTRLELAATQRSLAHTQDELADCRQELNAAKRLLQLRYPDEP